MQSSIPRHGDVRAGITVFGEERETVVVCGAAAGHPTVVDGGPHLVEGDDLVDADPPAVEGDSLGKGVEAQSPADQGSRPMKPAC